MKRTVDDPNSSERPPIFSSQMVMSGRLPCHITSTRVLPEESVILVRRRSGHSLALDAWVSGAWRAQCTDELEDEGSEADRTPELVPENGSDPVGDGVLGNSAKSSVVISKARSLVDTSMRDEFSISAEVNLSNMMEEGK